MSEYIPLSKAAERIGLTPRTLQRWCRDGLVAHSRYPNGRVCFNAEQLAGLTSEVQPVEYHPEALTPNPLFHPTRPRLVEATRGKR